MCFWLVLFFSHSTSLSIVLFSFIHQSQDEAMTKLRQEFEARASEQLKKYDQKLVTLRDELELRRKTEIHEIEEVHTYVHVCTIVCSWCSLNMTCGTEEVHGRCAIASGSFVFLYC